MGKKSRKKPKPRAGSLKVNKIDKPLVRLTKKRREITQIKKIRNKKGEVTMDTIEIQKNHERILSTIVC